MDYENYNTNSNANESVFDQLCRDSETGCYNDSYLDGYLPLSQLLLFA